jgi:hypothetical protein
VQSYAEPQSSGGMMEGRPPSTSTRSPGSAWPRTGQEQGQGPVGFALPPGAPPGASPGCGSRAPDSRGGQAEGRFVGVHQVGHVERSDGADF